MYAGRFARTFSRELADGNVFLGKFDKERRFEIDDSASRINASRVSKFFHGDELLLSELLHHPELYKNYPVLASLPVRVLRTEEGPSYFLLTGEIRLSAATVDVDDLRLSVLHEVQHAVQHIEGFDPGANTKLIAHKLTIAHRKDVGLDYSENISVTIMQDICTKAYNTYLRTTGEIEARDVVQRANLSKLERIAIAPYSSEVYSVDAAIRPAQADDLEVKLVRTKLRTKQMVMSGLSRLTGIVGWDKHSVDGNDATGRLDVVIADAAAHDPLPETYHVSIFDHPANKPRDYAGVVNVLHGLTGDELVSVTRRYAISQSHCEGENQWFTSEPDDNGKTYSLHVNAIGGREPTTADFEHVRNMIEVSVESNHLTMDA